MHFYISKLIFCAFFCCTVSFRIEDWLKNLPETEEVQKREVVTKLNTINFYYQWKIENFSLLKKGFNDGILKSPAFSMGKYLNDDYLWYINIYFEAAGNGRFDTYLILETKLNYNLKTKYSFGILDGNKEIFVQGPYEEIFGFNQNKHGVNGYWYLSQINESVTNQNDTLVIFCKGEIIIPSSKSAELKVQELPNLKYFNSTIINDLDYIMLQQILHFVYTGKTSNTKKLHTSLLAAFDNLELTQLLEENLFCKLNIETAAEIYKFMYLHQKTELKIKAIDFIKQNALEVMASEGWKSIMVSPDPNMLAEIFSSFAKDLKPRSTHTEETNTTEAFF